MNPQRSLTRRQAFQVGAAAAATVVAGFAARAFGQDPEPARLRSRPRRPRHSLTPGAHALGLERERDGVLILPSRYDAARAAPLAVILHGASGSAERMVRMLGSLDQ